MSITGTKMIKPYSQPSTLVLRPPPVGGGIKAGRKGVRFGKGEKGVGGTILVPVILRGGIILVPVILKKGRGVVVSF